MKLNLFLVLLLDLCLRLCVFQCSNYEALYLYHNSINKLILYDQRGIKLQPNNEIPIISKPLYISKSKPLVVVLPSAVNATRKID